jgi:hypothetical protein
MREKKLKQEDLDLSAMRTEEVSTYLHDLENRGYFFIDEKTLAIKNITFKSAMQITITQGNYLEDIKIQSERFRINILVKNKISELCIEDCTFENDLLYVEKNISLRVLRTSFNSKFYFSSEKVFLGASFISKLLLGSYANASNNTPFFTVTEIERAIKREEIQVSDTTIEDISLGENFNCEYIHISEDSKICSGNPEKEKRLFNKFKVIARNNNDPIQEHIFYTRELKAYSKIKNTKCTDKALIFLNKYFGGNGLSFWVPLIWLFVFNFSIVLVIYYFYFTCPKDTRYLWNGINISPLSSVIPLQFEKTEVPTLVYVLDGIRKPILAIFIYLTTSSALRFHYKK